MREALSGTRCAAPVDRAPTIVPSDNWPPFPRELYEQMEDLAALHAIDPEARQRIGVIIKNVHATIAS